MNLQRMMRLKVIVMRMMLLLGVMRMMMQTVKNMKKIMGVQIVMIAF